LQATDVKVTVRLISTGVETTLVKDTDYSVDTVQAEITLIDAGQAWLITGFLRSTYAMTLRRVRDVTQETDVRNQGDFFPEAHENAFDHEIMVAQQLTDELARSIHLPVTEAGSEALTTLPAADQRASKFLAFDASGNPLASEGSGTPATAFMATVLDDPDAATARATLDVPSNAEAILDALIDAKGDLIVGSAADTPARLAVGTNDQALLAASGEATGAKWGPIPLAGLGALTTKGDLLAFTTAHARLAVGTDGQGLIADSTQASGLKWAVPEAIDTTARLMAMAAMED